MKNLFLLPVFLFVIGRSFCQAPIVDTTWLPHQGSVFYKYGVATLSPDKVTDTGANIIWDFSHGYFSNTPHDSVYFYNPSSVSFNCSNNLVNLIEKVKDSDYYHYCLIKNVSGVYVAEANFRGATGDTIGEYYPRPFRWLIGGISYRDEFRDTATLFYKSLHSLPTDSPFRDIISRWIKYDGYGVLKVPGRTFDTVVRYHVRTFQKDSIFYNGSYMTDFNGIDAYYWYSRSIRYPVLEYSTNYYLHYINNQWDSQAPRTYITYSLNSNTLTGSGSRFIPNDPGISVFTLDGNIMLKSTKPNEEKLNYEIIEAAGKIIDHGELSLYRSAQAIGKSKIEPGFYLVRIMDNKGETEVFKINLNQ